MNFDVRETSMNTGDSHRNIFRRGDRERSRRRFAGNAARFRRTSALEIFFHQGRNLVAQKTILALSASCDTT
jgi:hypothetical protein